jgi:hypothetical protein
MAAEPSQSPAPYVPGPELRTAIEAELQEANMHEIRLKELRATIEERLGLAAGTLLTVKDQFKALVIEVVTALQGDEDSESEDDGSAATSSARVARGRAAPVILLEPLRKLLSEDRLQRSEVSRGLQRVQTRR